MKNILTKLWIILSLALCLNADETGSMKVFGSSPPMNYLLYAINPDKMMGLNFEAKNINNQADEKYLKKSFLSLPIIGSFHGAGGGINIETLASYNPDLILIWEDDIIFDTLKDQLQRLKIKTLTIPFRKMQTMPSSIQIAADALGEHKRGKELSAYATTRLERLKNLTKDAHIKYYYAEGNDGLYTECSNSFHTEAMDFVGGINVHKCTQSGVQGLERISFEKLLEYDPDIIIAQNSMVYDAIKSNKLFAHLRAIKNNNIIIIPNKPFNWVDRPPSFMRLIGMEYLAKNFYPQLYRDDLNEQIKSFYRLFLDVNLSDEDIQNITYKGKK